MGNGEHNYTEQADSANWLFWKKQIIKRESGETYLYRRIIFRSPFGSLMFHKIYLTDNDCLHDHPWGFMSIILKGGYVEHTKTGSKLYGVGSILLRKPEFAHRLEVWQPTWTLVFTTPKKRTWGFWTPKGWIRWIYYKSTNSCE